MKNIFILLVVSLTLASCGGGDKQSVDDLIAGGDLEKIRARRTEIKTQQEELQLQLDQMDAAIRELDKSESMALVTTATINDTLFKHFIEVQGNVTTRQNVIIYPEYQGTLVSVLVKEGDQVRKGQLLGRIDDGGLGSQLGQLQVQEELARTTYERQKRLWDQQIGSEIQYLQAKTNYEASKNAVEQLQSQLAKTQITAPFSGTIDDVITDQGTVVSPGQALFRIVNLDEMFIEAEVPERYLKTVTPGKDVAINLPILGQTIASQVRQTGNYIKPSNRSFSIEVDVPNDTGNIKPNLTARLRINDYTNPEALLIPLSVISENSLGEQYVYVIQKDSANSGGDIATRKIITTGLTQGDFTEVTSGIEAGEAIIIEGARTVKDGQTVRVLNQ